MSGDRKRSLSARLLSLGREKKRKTVQNDVAKLPNAPIVATHDVAEDATYQWFPDEVPASFGQRVNGGKLKVEPQNNKVKSIFILEVTREILVLSKHTCFSWIRWKGYSLCGTFVAGW